MSVNAEIIIIISGIFPWHNNGVAVSVLRKIRLMETAWGIKPLLVITNYDPDLNRTCRILRHIDATSQSTSLSEGTQVFGVYNHFQHMPDILPETSYDYQKERTDRIFHASDGIQVKQIEHYRESTDRLRLVERLDERGRVKQNVYYDDCGVMSMVRAVDPNHPERWLCDYYLTYDQKVCLKTEYRFDESRRFQYGGNTVTGVTAYNNDGDTLFTCADEIGLTAYCMDQLTSDLNKTFIIIEEDCLHSPSLNTLKKPNVIRTCMVHNIFNINPYDINSEPSPFFTNLCNHYADYNGIVFLTEGERRDFLEKYRDCEVAKTCVIPHPYPCKAGDAQAAGRPASPPQADERAYPCKASDAQADERAYDTTQNVYSTRDIHKAVIIARFDAQKRIDAAISIFKRVVDKVPDARLEIYGYATDDLLEQYQRLIKDLRLTNNVNIIGFTSNAASVFRGAALSMFTSVAEGYGLTIIESICNGCPVFAYDIKYGPSDLIADCETGYLFKDGDDDAFAEKIIAYFNDADLQKRMSKNTYDAAPQFSKETYLAKWRDFIKMLKREGDTHGI
jgi:poly(glycerol-phosphate) alpha-glucosyltransferase